MTPAQRIPLRTVIFDAARDLNRSATSNDLAEMVELLKSAAGKIRRANALILEAHRQETPETENT